MEPSTVRDKIYEIASSNKSFFPLLIQYDHRDHPNPEVVNDPGDIIPDISFRVLKTNYNNLEDIYI